MTGMTTDLKRFAVHDGPGVRTTLFLKGCSLRCRWCHNPENISPSPETGFLERKCAGCGKCVEVCPNGAHRLSGRRHIFDRTKCVACGKCAEVCFSGALKYYGRRITVAEAVDAILEDKAFYVNSGGGCTISGGEPLLQAAFCAGVFKRLRDSGIHCAIDTSGAVGWDAFETVLPHTDMFLYDLKHTDDRRHREHTGGSNRLILSNLRRLSQCGVPVEIRIPMVPGFNADDASLDAAGEMLSRLANIAAVRLLPYHDLARSKYAMLGYPDTLPPAPSPTAEQMHSAARLTDFGLTVKTSGAIKR